VQPPFDDGSDWSRHDSNDIFLLLGFRLSFQRPKPQLSSRDFIDFANRQC
jgi:hypothetical protein